MEDIMSDESFDIIDATEKAAESVQQELQVPAGYIPVKLSSNGNYGAPKVFHIKAFDPQDIINLSLSENEDMPIKTAQLLQEVIFEKDAVNVLMFHKDLAIEMLIFLVATFYNKEIEVPYKPTTEDRLFMQKAMNEVDFANWTKGVDSGIRKYSYKIDLSTLSFYEVKDGDKAPTKITIKKPGFVAKFTYPKYGDAVVLKRAVDERFGERDKSFEKPYRIYKNYQEMKARFEGGDKSIDMDKVPYLPKTEEKKLKEYEKEKLNFTIYLTKGMHLLELNGEDMTNKSLIERAAAIDKCASFDHPTFENLSKKLAETIKVGVVHNVKVQNPITGAPMEVDYPFRELDLFAALKDISPDAGGITYEVE